MFVRTKTLKSGNQTQQYYQLVETIKERNIPRQRVIYTLGKVEDYDEKKVDEIICALEEYAGEIKILKSFDDFAHIWSKTDGDIFALEEMWDEMDLDNFFFRIIHGSKKYTISTIQDLKAFIFHQVLTKNRIPIKEWLEDSVNFPSSEEITMKNLKIAYAFFSDHKEGIEEGLAPLFSSCINTYDTRVVYGGFSFLEFPHYSRSFTKDKIRFPIFFVLDREGLPLEYHIRPYYSHPSPSYFLEQAERIKEKYSPNNYIFIDDQGILKKEEALEIKAENCDFLSLFPRSIWRDIGRNADTYRGRFSRITADLHIKEYSYGGERFIQCLYHSQKSFDDEMLQSFVRDIKKEINNLDALRRKAYELQEDELKGLFIKRNYDKLQINKSSETHEDRFTGSTILHLSNPKIDSDEIALVWNHFLALSSSINPLHCYQNIDTFFKYAEERVRAHMSLMVMSYALERFFGKKLSLAGLRIENSEGFRRLEWMKVSRIRLSEKEFLVRVDSNEQAKEVLEALHYRQPFRIEEIEEEVDEDLMDDLWEEGEEVED